jgi:2'-5' RNA ligase
MFVGVKVAPEIASDLTAHAAGLDDPSVRLVAPTDIHLTLVPPWNESSIPEAVEKLTSVAGRFRAFPLTYQHIGYGPQADRPRLLWVECAATDDIMALRSALLQAFGQTDERPFRPHVTLARVRGNGRRVARKHPIDQKLSFTQRIESVELFRSPPPGRRGYRIIASVRLGDPTHAILAASRGPG